MTDLATLFAMNPLDLTREDLTAVVTKFRESRGQFTLGSKTAGSTKPPTAKQAQTNDLLKKLDISIDL